MTQALEPKTERWLALADACRILGVNASTLRQWADSGRLRAFRTMGGHRRFLREDIESLLQSVAQPSFTTPKADLGQLALARIRQRVHREERQADPWLESFDAEGKVRLRLLGRELVSLATQHLSQRRHRPQFLEEARVLGSQYGKEMLSLSIPLSEAIKAFLFFRNSFVSAVETSLKGTAPLPDDSLDVQRELNDVFDQVLIAIAEVYSKTLPTQPKQRSN